MRSNDHDLANEWGRSGAAHIPVMVASRRKTTKYPLAARRSEYPWNPPRKPANDASLAGSDDQTGRAG